MLVSGDDRLDKSLPDAANSRSRGVAARQRGDRTEALKHFRVAAELEPRNAGGMNEVATELRELGRLDEAEAVYRKVVAEHPAFAPGRRGLALLARQRGDRTEALEHFRAAAKLEPHDAWRANEVATELRELGRLDEAEAVYRKLVAEHPAFAPGRRGLALLARQRGDRTEALKHFRAAAELEPQNAGGVNEVATELRGLGRFDEAEAVYRKVVAENPAFAPGRRGLALLARQRGDRTEALAHFRAAAKLEPHDAWRANEVATELRELGRLDEAEEVFRKLVAQHPAFVPGRRGLALLARQRGDRTEALKHFRAAAELDTRNAGGVNEVATELRELGRLNEAEAVYRKVVAENPAFAPARRGLALLARQRGARTEALEHFRAAAEIEPHDAWRANEVATELRELGRLDEAEQRLESFVDRYPQSAQGLIFYANNLRNKTAAHELIVLFEKAAAIEPDHLQAKLALASEYRKIWRLADADAMCDAALSLQDGNPLVFLEKGRIARQLGQRETALKFFEMAAAAPGAPDAAIVELSRELLDAGRSDEAQHIVLARLSLNPNLPSLHTHLGYIARMMGDRTAARAAYARAAELSAAEIQARIELATEEFQDGQAVQAIDRLMVILQENPRRARAIETLALFVQQLGDWEGAVSVWRTAIRIDSSNLWSHSQLAHALARLGRLPEAALVLAECEDKFGPAPGIETTRARICTDSGDRSGALELLTKACARFPGHFDIWHQRVMSLINCGAVDEAQRLLDAAPAGSVPENARVSILRAHLAAALWDLDGAYRYFVDAMRFNASDPWVNDCAAKIALMRVDIQSTQSHLEASVRYSPIHRTQHGGLYKTSQTHIGQFLDEFRLDKVGLQRLQDCLADANPVAVLAELVMEMPDYTPAALNLIISLRKSGQLAFPAKQSEPLQRSIPAQIAQFWDEDIPSDVETLCDEWRANNPTFSYNRFSTSEARRFLADRGPNGALDAFNRAVEPAMKADIFRLAFLYHEGGYYADADDRCLAPLTTIDSGDCDLLLYQEDFGTIGNNFIGAIPRHPVIGHALDSAIEAVNRGDTDVVWLATGPALLTRSVALYLAQNIEEGLTSVRILDRLELARTVAIHCITSYRHTQRHWLRTTFKGQAARIPAWSQMLQAAAALETE